MVKEGEYKMGKFKRVSKFGQPAVWVEEGVEESVVLPEEVVEEKVSAPKKKTKKTSKKGKK